MNMKSIKFFILFIFLASLFCIVYADDNYAFPDLVDITTDKYGREIIKPHFAARDIKRATSIGFIDGYEDGTFKPNNDITREEFIKMLIVLATNWSFDFSAVESKYETWAGPYVAVAEMQGIIEKGQYTEEELKKPITRVEMVTMLSKTQIRMKGIPMNREGHLVYTDIDSLTNEERSFLLHAAKYDLLAGMKDGKNTLFEPFKNLTRGEAAMALMRVY